MKHLEFTIFLALAFTTSVSVACGKPSEQFVEKCPPSEMAAIIAARQPVTVSDPQSQRHGQRTCPTGYFLKDGACYLNKPAAPPTKFK